MPATYFTYIFQFAFNDARHLASEMLPSIYNIIKCNIFIDFMNVSNNRKKYESYCQLTLKYMYRTITICIVLMFFKYVLIVIVTGFNYLTNTISKCACMHTHALRIIIRVKYQLT